MRRKTTIRNYGCYPEVCFVCNHRYFKYCANLAQYMSNQYGVVATAVDYAAFPQGDREMKKMLRTAYHVIFMLSDGVIEECVSVPNHPFLQLYSYVHDHNGFAMSCAALDGYVVQDGLTYPPVMNGFDNMHRKALSTRDPQGMAKTLAREIRLYYSNYQKISLAHAHRVGISGYVALLCGMEKYRWAHLLCSIVPIAFLVILMGVVQWDVMSAMSFYTIFMLPAYITYAILDNAIHIRRKCALFTNLEYKEDVEDYYTLPALQRQLTDKVTAMKRSQLFKTILRIVGYFVYTILIMGYSTQEPELVSYMVLLLFAHLAWCVLCSVSVFMENVVVQARMQRGDTAHFVSQGHKKITTITFWARHVVAAALAVACWFAVPI